MQIGAPLPGVAARLGVAAGAHHGDAEWQQRVAQNGGFARAEHDAHLRETQPQRADELDERAIRQRMLRRKLPGARTQPRHADGELRPPADAQQMLQMRRQRQRLGAPIHEAKKRADSDAPEPARISALRARQPPVEILFRSRRVHLRVGRAVVGFLIHDQPLRPGRHERRVVGRLHRRDFQRDARDLFHQSAHALREVAVRDEFRMLPRHEQEVAKTLRREVPRLLQHGRDVERHAQDRVVAREAAVGAVVDALVGKIKRREKADRLAEMAARHCGGIARQRTERGVVQRLQQRVEPAQQRGFLRRKNLVGERHGAGGAGICGPLPRL